MSELHGPRDYAFAYAARGYAVFPVWGTTEDGSCTCGSATCNHSPKAPHGMLGSGGGFHHATTDRTKLGLYWDNEPGAGIGLAVTPDNGLIVLDVDLYKDPDALNWLVEAVGGSTAAKQVLAGVPVQRTARGGLHMVFRRPKDSTGIRLRKDIPTGLEWKGNGYIVVAPTMNRSGEEENDTDGTYHWVRHSLLDMNIHAVPEIPEAVFDALFTRYDLDTSGVDEDDLPILTLLNEVDPLLGFTLTAEEIQRRYDSRHDGLLAMAVFARKRGYASATILDALMELRDELNPLADREIPDEEVRRIVRNVSEYQISESAVRERVKWALKSGSIGEGAKRRLTAFLTGEILDDDEEPEEPGTADEPEEMDEETAAVRRLNERYSLVIYGSNAFVAELDYFNSETGVREIRLLQTGTFKLMHDIEQINVGTGQRPKWVGVGSLWLRHPLRRTAERGLVFAPEQIVEGAENLWRGWGVEESDQDWSILREQLFYLCNKDEALFEYMLSWCAYCVQNPGEVAVVVPVFTGAQGIGKSMFWSAFARLFGVHGKHITSQSLVGGRFNAFVADACFILFDEVLWGGDKAAAGALKNLASEETITLERKGKDAIMIRNRAKFVICSNNPWAAPIERTNRRFLPIHVEDEMKQGRDFYAKVAAACADRRVLGGMLRDLRRRDLTGFDLHNLPNEGLRSSVEQLARGLDPVETWWLECLDSGALPYLHQGNDDFDSAFDRAKPERWPEYWVTRERVLKSFLAFCNERRLHTYEGMTQIALATRLRQMCKGVEDFNPRYQPVSNRAVRHFRFGTLDEHREAWYRYIGSDQWGWKEDE